MYLCRVQRLVGPKGRKKLLQVFAASSVNQGGRTRGSGWALPQASVSRRRKLRELFDGQVFPFRKFPAIPRIPYFFFDSRVTREPANLMILEIHGVAVTTSFIRPSSVRSRVLNKSTRNFSSGE